MNTYNAVIVLCVQLALDVVCYTVLMNAPVRHVITHQSAAWCIIIEGPVMYIV
jgi:hypothetical protein